MRHSGLSIHRITKAIVLKFIYNDTVIINPDNKNTFARFKTKRSGFWQEYSLSEVIIKSGNPEKWLPIKFKVNLSVSLRKSNKILC